jgi:hypothetical protein
VATVARPVTAVRVVVAAKVAIPDSVAQAAATAAPEGAEGAEGAEEEADRGEEVLAAPATQEFRSARRSRSTTQSYVSGPAVLKETVLSRALTARSECSSSAGVGREWNVRERELSVLADNRRFALRPRP